MKVMNNFIKSKVGRKFIAACFDKHMSQTGKTLEHVYQDGYFEIDEDDKTEKQISRPVIWAGTEELLEAVLGNRNQIGTYTIQVLANGGQGFSK